MFDYCVIMLCVTCIFPCAVKIKYVIPKKNNYYDTTCSCHFTNPFKRHTINFKEKHLALNVVPDIVSNIDLVGLKLERKNVCISFTNCTTNLKDELSKHEIDLKFFIS